MSAHVHTDMDTDTNTNEAERRSAEMLWPRPGPPELSGSPDRYLRVESCPEPEPEHWTNTVSVSCLRSLSEPGSPSANNRWVSHETVFGDCDAGVGVFDCVASPQSLGEMPTSQGMYASSTSRHQHGDSGAQGDSAKKLKGLRLSASALFPGATCVDGGCLATGTASGEWVSEGELARCKKERSTLLVRRFYRNNQQVCKSVWTGTRAIVRTLPSGGIGERAWDAILKCARWAQDREDLTRTVMRWHSRHTGNRLFVRLQESMAVSGPGVLLMEVVHSVSGECCGCESWLLHPCQRRLSSQWRVCACGVCVLCVLCATGASRYWAAPQRTCVSSRVSGTFQEAVASLGVGGGTRSAPSSCSGSPPPRAMPTERQLSSPMAGCGSGAVSSPGGPAGGGGSGVVSGISKELVELRHLIQFPEEVAAVLTEQELQLYRRVLPLDYLSFLTHNLTAHHQGQGQMAPLGEGQSQGRNQQQHPQLRVSLSAPNMPVCSQQSNAVEDLVSRFNECPTWVSR